MSDCRSDGHADCARAGHRARTGSLPGASSRSAAGRSTKFGIAWNFWSLLAWNISAWIAPPRRSPAAKRSASGSPRKSVRNLRGVLYVLDEPSIGLHPRDNGRLLDSLHSLRDLGNTVLVVEHDADTIERADYVIDLGPGAGRLGGHLVAQGTPHEIENDPASLTGQYFSGARRIPIPKRAVSRTAAHRDPWRRRTQSQEIDVDFPLGLFIAGHRRFGQRQIDAGERYSVSRCRQARLRFACGARRARIHRRARSDR